MGAAPRLSPRTRRSRRQDRATEVLCVRARARHGAPSAGSTAQESDARRGLEAADQRECGDRSLIPHGYIAEWRAQAPWPDDFQVEQDLVISRVLVEIFSHPVLRDALAFRGGTALYKLHLRPARYSEDIDLVQTRAEPAGPMMDALRSVLDPWLGKPRWKQTDGRVTFLYRFNSEGVPATPLK